MTITSNRTAARARRMRRMTGALAPLGPAAHGSIREDVGEGFDLLDEAVFDLEQLEGHHAIRELERRRAGFVAGEVARVVEEEDGEDETAFLVDDGEAALADSLD